MLKHSFLWSPPGNLPYMMNYTQVDHSQVAEWAGLHSNSQILRLLLLLSLLGRHPYIVNCNHLEK
jgi:hypothetical protein